MDFNTYQQEAKLSLRCYPDSLTAIMCVHLGLPGEVGEICEILKRYYREGDLNIDELGKEIGDVLRYLAILCELYDLDLNTIAKENKLKVRKRIETGSLLGNGNNR